ncbi:protease modulator HflC [Pseudoxanthomonas helianthi]|uniref:Protein HflC n=1 Tax=Pseudoxanthomonas helianthi TaxID=1453541 RepID=A0A940X557_9GAMM|nr:protease modulator HflC [Pseudoxanthomonas helianthi]MBP3985959.1 protease modulator HflC [Pseudoxanthomonas helianthi]
MKISVIVALVVALLLGLMGSVYQVREGEVALILNLGRVTRSDIGPGLHFRLPLIESARVFDRRLNVLDSKPERFYTDDKQGVDIDFFAIGRVNDARAFYLATGGVEKEAVLRLAPIIKNALTGEINGLTLPEVVSGDRSKFVQAKLSVINRGAATLGVEITDIRIKRIELPQDSNVLDSVYNQMRSQRLQVANQRRAEGVEQAQTIRAKADADQQVLLAEAERDAQRLRGEGDAQAAAIYAEAANKDPGFYAFQRSLEAYRGAFADGNGVIVLDRNDPFLQYLKSDR